MRLRVGIGIGIGPNARIATPMQLTTAGFP